MAGEIPDVLIARVMRAVVHPTLVRLLVAIAPAKIKYSTGCLWDNDLGSGGGAHGDHCGDRRVAFSTYTIFFLFLFFLKRL